MKPIIFNTAMVQAILSGQKTQTRRIANAPVWTKAFVPDCIRWQIQGSKHVARFLYRGNTIGWFDLTPPYQKGDIMYVRETYDELPITPTGLSSGAQTYIYYRADGDLRPEAWRGAWKPSIHMPKAAARIFLKVTDVRIEHVQDITDNDAIAEGCCGREYVDENGSPIACVYPSEEFSRLWDWVAKDGYRWKDNPYVWVIKFERCEKPQGE